MKSTKKPTVTADSPLRHNGDSSRDSLAKGADHNDSGALEMLGKAYAGAHAPEILDTVYQLCAELDKAHINYCHWKSNAALERSASGENDLDLLVDRPDVERFTAILHQLGFKRALAPADKAMPGVQDYYGYDASSGKLVHVHAHYQLILGSDLTKNYRLPIEKQFLASRIRDGVFQIPAPEYEFLVFVIRMVLKHSTWATMLVRHGKMSASESMEFDYLKARVDWTAVQEVRQQCLPQIGQDLFDRCLQALLPDCSRLIRIRTGWRLQKILAVHARRGQLRNNGLVLLRRADWAFQRRFLKRVSNRRLANGGAIIAILGGDGAGKSTAVDELATWLSKDLEVRKIHLGKPRWSLTTVLIRGTLKAGRILGKPFMSDRPVSTTRIGEESEFPGYTRLLWEFCTAHDRDRTYRKAQRFAVQGGLVISDRFPSPQIKLMDGPQIERLVGDNHLNWFIRFLIRKEQQWHASFVSPELMVVLKLEPEIAVKRKPEENPAYVRLRSREVWEIDWQATPAFVIDAGKDKAAVLSNLKYLVWFNI